MFEIRPQRFDRFGDILLLDVGVEGVDRDADAWMPNRLAEILCLGCRSQKKCLRAVHGLNGNRDLVLFCNRANLLKDLYCPAMFVVVRPMLGQISNGRKKRTAQDSRTAFRGGFDAGCQMPQRRPPNFRIGADGVDWRRQDSADGAFERIRFKGPPNWGGGELGGIKERDLEP